MVPWRIEQCLIRSPEALRTDEMEISESIFNLLLKANGFSIRRILETWISNTADLKSIGRNIDFL